MHRFPLKNIIDGIRHTSWQIKKQQSQFDKFNHNCLHSLQNHLNHTHEMIFVLKLHYSVFLCEPRVKCVMGKKTQRESSPDFTVCLSCMEGFSVFQLIVLVLWPKTLQFDSLSKNQGEYCTYIRQMARNTTSYIYIYVNVVPYLRMCLLTHLPKTVSWDYNI